MGSYQATRKSGKSRNVTQNKHETCASRRTLQNKVRLKVLPEQLTLFVNTFVAFEKCIIQ